MRKIPLVTENIYHVFNKSIAKYIIFNNNEEFLRFFNVIVYYQRKNLGVEFSRFIENPAINKNSPLRTDVLKKAEKLVDIIAYCLMPTHFHLVVKQLIDEGISKFVGNIQNSYSRYFNLKHQRRGPLWEGKFKGVLVDSDEQLLHLTRYVHLNPVEANLTEKPEDWLMSSYKEYLSQVNQDDKICNFEEDLSIELESYGDFVNDYLSCQKDLENMKPLFIDGTNQK